MRRHEATGPATCWPVMHPVKVHYMLGTVLGAGSVKSKIRSGVLTSGFLVPWEELTSAKLTRKMSSSLYLLKESLQGQHVKVKNTILSGITRAAPKLCPHGLWGTRLSARHGRWYPSTAPADSMPLSLPLCPKPWVLRGSWPLVTPQTPGTLRTPPSAPSPPLASLPEHHQPHLRFQLPSRCSWPLYWVEAVPPNSCSCGTSESELHWKSGFCRCN